MYVKIDVKSDVPVYLQLVYAIKEGIARGELKEGTELPSVRAMGADLGIHMHTVNKAYQLLRDEGFLLIEQKKRVVVNPDGLPKADELFYEELKDNLQPLVTDSVCRNLSEEKFMNLCKQLFAQYTVGKGEV